MKTYRLWLWSRLTDEWVQAAREPHTFNTFEDASIEMVMRTFKYNGIQYKIVESEEQQS